MPRFRKKPVEVEAIQWLGSKSWDVLTVAFPFGGYLEDGCAYIETLEGVMCARPGDWIIRGVRGEVYPVKPDIFAETYEPIAGGGEPQSDSVTAPVSASLAGAPRVQPEEAGTSHRAVTPAARPAAYEVMYAALEDWPRLKTEGWKLGNGLCHHTARSEGGWVLVWRTG